VEIRWADHVTPSTRKIGTNLADKRRSLGRYSSIADQSYGIIHICILQQWKNSGFDNLKWKLGTSSVETCHAHKHFISKFTIILPFDERSEESIVK
jgi:hypothetical protein